MAELEAILSAVSTALQDINAADIISAFPADSKKRFVSPVIAIGVRKGETVSAGFSEYMGERFDQEHGTYYEVYGKKLELTLGVDIYAPKDSGAGACLDVAAEVISLLPTLPSGIKVKSFSCGEARFDTVTGMFLLRAEMHCLCFMYADKTDDAELLNFTLRGVLTD